MSVVCVVTLLMLVAAPVGLTRASGALAKVDAFAAKPALPVAAPVQRANALDSLQVLNGSACVCEDPVRRSPPGL